MILDAIQRLGLWSWWIGGLILLGLEVVLPGTFFLWFGIAAMLTGALALLVDALLADALLAYWSWQVEVVIFLALAVVLVVFGRRYFARRKAAEAPTFLNERAGRLVGSVHVLAEPIVDGNGRIRVDDTVWRIVGADSPSGQRVTVVAVEGAVLKVAPAR